MAMEMRQQLKLSQQLVMTPQLQQAIKLLQLSRMELVDLVREEMLENPILEEVQAQEEQREIEKDILDQLAGAPDVDTVMPEALNGGDPATNGAGDAQVRIPKPASSTTVRRKRIMAVPRACASRCPPEAPACRSGD